MMDIVKWWYFDQQIETHQRLTKTEGPEWKNKELEKKTSTEKRTHVKNPKSPCEYVPDNYF